MFNFVSSQSYRNEFSVTQTDNNWCGLQNYNNSDAWNFGTWDNWAKTKSPNRDVKIYIGASASPSAGDGYVDPGTLSTIIQETMAQYSSFGGVMLWDASQAYGLSSRTTRV